MTLLSSYYGAGRDNIRSRTMDALPSLYGAGRDNIKKRRRASIPSLYGAVHQLYKYTVTGYNWRTLGY